MQPILGLIYFGTDANLYDIAGTYGQVPLNLLRF
jgi:hypothetical protein